MRPTPDATTMLESAKQGQACQRHCAPPTRRKGELEAPHGPSCDRRGARYPSSLVRPHPPGRPRP
eukprot:12090671-Alexandrium_andersonii.AAC.1